MKNKGLTVAALSLATLAVIGYFAWGQYRQYQLTEEKLAPDQFVVVRTEGGMLEVSTLVKKEVFAWQTSWSCPLNLCSSLGKTISSIRVPAHYTYRIPLAKEWTLRFRDGYYELRVPKVNLNFPSPLNCRRYR